MKRSYTAFQVLRNWMRLGVILGIAPWAYYCVISVVPALAHVFGLTRIIAGFYLVPILVPPALLLWLLGMDGLAEEPDPADTPPAAAQAPLAVRFDDWGIHVKAQGREHSRIAWQDVRQVLITITGAPLSYPHWQIGNEHGGVVVPNDATGGMDLFKALPARLPGFDRDESYRAIMEACSASEGSFVIWRATS
jgi:hypothetical protein